ncbi:MAG: DegT/DnrJ/EryC1/StrS family aminotransferase, partial [Myxococcales bacterium]|nr:DegT/DnrJ/EryC1/StrS family aminotransferase [Myxococcales bacterium]
PYFWPPLHHHPAFSDARLCNLEVTERVALETICFPMHSTMEESTLERVVAAVARIQYQQREIRSHFSENAAISA